MQFIDLYPNRIPAWFNLQLYDAAKKLTESEWRGNLGFRRLMEGHISCVEESVSSISKALLKDEFNDQDQAAIMPLGWVQDDLETIQRHPVLMHKPGYQPNYYQSVRRVTLNDIADTYSVLAESLNSTETSLLTPTQKAAFCDVYKNYHDEDYAENQIPVGDRLDAYYEDVLGIDDSSLLIHVDLWSDQDEDEIVDEFREILRDFRGKSRKKRWGKHDTARLYQNMVLPILDMYLAERHANMITSNKVLLYLGISHMLDEESDVQQVLDSFEPSKYTALDYKRVLGLEYLEDNTMLKRVRAAKQWMADFGRMPNIHHIKSQGN